MNPNTITVLFALLRSAVFDAQMTDEEKTLFSDEMLSELYAIAQKHSISPLLAYGLRRNGLAQKDDKSITQTILLAAFRCEQLNHELSLLCNALESAEIPFIPLKGAVLCDYYPEPWMRTRCDIDILVHRDDLGKAISRLVQSLRYEEKERATHDVLLLTPGGIHIELHFDLIEEGRANRANDVLASVWENVSLRENYNFWYEMSDAYFYFYHIAHMAAHFETGGCGIRPFVDLYLLDNTEQICPDHRDGVLKEGDLLHFAEISRELSRSWFAGKETTALTQKMQDFILHGGTFGSVDNRVALNQQKQGGRFGYLISRVFIPYPKLKRYYPILEKHRWLLPVMQIKRWFMLLKPDVARRTKSELAVNGSIEKSKANEMKLFLDDIGIR